MDFLKLKPEVIDDIDAGIAVEIQSSPGLGKSEFVKQLVADLSLDKIMLQDVLSKKW